MVSQLARKKVVDITIVLTVSVVKKIKMTVKAETLLSILHLSLNNIFRIDSFSKGYRLWRHAFFL